MSTKPKDLKTKTLIYVMKDPTSLEIRYVGKTTTTLIKRLGQHISDSYKSKNHRAYWIQSILKENKIPCIEQIDECSWDESQSLETYYIAKYRADGYNLVNETVGGEGVLGRISSEETILKHKEAARNKLEKIYQYDLDGNFIKEWNNAPEAAEYLGCKNASGITRCLRGERFKYKDFIWKFEFIESPDEVIKDYKESKELKRKRNIEKSSKGYMQKYLGRLISQESKLINTPFIGIYNLNEELLYEAISLRDAACYVNELLNRQNIDASTSIKRCLDNNTAYYGEYKFKNLSKSELVTNTTKALIIVKYSDKLFYGIDEAAKYFNVNRSNIVNNLNGTTKFLTTSEFGKIKLEWKVNSSHNKLYLATYGLTSDELNEIGHNEIN